MENDFGDHPESVRLGIMTGILLAIARIAGETAPLLFTALSNQFWSTDMMQPIANLPVTIFKFAMSPFAEWQQLAWAGADHHPLRTVAEHSGARHFREEETRLNFYGAAARGAE